MSIRLKNPENSHDPKLLNLSRYYCEYHYIPPLPPLHAQGLLAQNLGFSAPCLLWESPASWSASAGNPAQPCREGLESTPSAYLTEKREQETKPWGGTKKVLLCIAMNHINPDEKEDRTTLICSRAQRKMSFIQESNTSDGGTWTQTIPNKQIKKSI